MSDLVETCCDTCGKAFKPDDDVVLMGERGNFHQACFRQMNELTELHLAVLEQAARIVTLETAIRTALAECRGLEVYRILDAALAEGQDK